jgi:hypothetical protein
LRLPPGTFRLSGGYLMQLHYFWRALQIAFLGGVIFVWGAGVVLAANPSKLLSEGPAQPNQSLSDWQKHMIANPPQGNSCFTAKYPDTNWQPQACARVSPPRMQPVVGIGNDYVASQGPIQGPIISQAEGSFPAALPGLTSEMDGMNPNQGAPGTGRPDDFSLQLNTQLFTNNTLATDPFPVDTYPNGFNNTATQISEPCISPCMGWIQFVYSNQTSAPHALVYMQLSMINFPTNCQAGWTPALTNVTINNKQTQVITCSNGVSSQPGTACPVSFNSVLGINPAISNQPILICFVFSAPSPVNPTNTNTNGTPVPITDLGNLRLVGIASSSGCTTGGTAPSVTAMLFEGGVASMPPPCVWDAFNLAQSWREVEFNVFGLANLSEAQFNPGGPGTTTIRVRTEITTGSASAPTCPVSGWTGESNSLFLVTNIQPNGCCPYGGASPAIEFLESNAGATGSCGPAHLAQNFNDPEGLAFDSSGNLWVANAGNSSIAIICLASSPICTGQIPYVQTVLQGNPLNQPSRLAFDMAGDLYVANTGSAKSPVLKYTAPITSMSAPKTIYNDSINRPLGIAIDENYLYIVNNGNGTLTLLDPRTLLPNGNPPSLAPDSAPGAIALGPNGSGLLIGNGPSGAPSTIDLFGLPPNVHPQGAPLARDAHNTGPTGIAIDANAIYVSDLYSGNAVVYPNNIVNKSSNAAPIVLQSNQTGYCEGIAVAPNSQNPSMSTVYVANSAWNSISVFSVDFQQQTSSYIGSYQ